MCLTKAKDWVILASGFQDADNIFQNEILFGKVLVLLVYTSCPKVEQGLLRQWDLFCVFESALGGPERGRLMESPGGLFTKKSKEGEQGFL